MNFPLLIKMLYDSNFWRYFNKPTHNENGLIYSRRCEILEKTLQNFTDTIDKAPVRVCMMNFDKPLKNKLSQPVYQAHAGGCVMMRLFMLSDDNLSKTRPLHHQIRNIVQFVAHEYRHIYQWKMQRFGYMAPIHVFPEEFIQQEHTAALKNSKPFDENSHNSNAKLKEYFSRKIEIDAHAYELAVCYVFLQKEHNNVHSFLKEYRQHTHGHDGWVALYLRGLVDDSVKKRFLSKFGKFVNIMESSR